MTCKTSKLAISGLPRPLQLQLRIKLKAISWTVESTRRLKVILKSPRTLITQTREVRGSTICNSKRHRYQIKGNYRVSQSLSQPMIVTSEDQRDQGEAPKPTKNMVRFDLLGLDWGRLWWGLGLGLDNIIIFI